MKSHQEQPNLERKEGSKVISSGDIIIPNPESLNNWEVLGWEGEEGKGSLRVEQTIQEKRKDGTIAKKITIVSIPESKLSGYLDKKGARIERRPEVPRNLQEGDLVVMGSGKDQQRYKISGVEINPDDKESGGGYFRFSRKVNGGWTNPAKMSFKDFYEKRTAPIEFAGKLNAEESSTKPTTEKRWENKLGDVIDIPGREKRFRFVGLSPDHQSIRGKDVNKNGAETSREVIDIAIKNLPEETRTLLGLEGVPPQVANTPATEAPPVTTSVKSKISPKPQKTEAVQIKKENYLEGNVLTDTRTGAVAGVERNTKKSIKFRVPKTGEKFELSSQAEELRDIEKQIADNKLNVQKRKEGLDNDYKKAKEVLTANKLPEGLEWMKKGGKIYSAGTGEEVDIVDVVERPKLGEKDDPVLRDGYVVLGFKPREVFPGQWRNKTYKTEVIPFYKLAARKENILAQPIEENSPEKKGAEPMKVTLVKNEATEGQAPQLKFEDVPLDEFLKLNPEFKKEKAKEAILKTAKVKVGEGEENWTVLGTWLEQAESEKMKQDYEKYLNRGVAEREKAELAEEAKRLAETRDEEGEVVTGIDLSENLIDDIAPVELQKNLPPQLKKKIPLWKKLGGPSEIGKKNKKL